MDKDIVLYNKNPNCEVMLGKHDLYPKIGGSMMQLDGCSLEQINSPKTHLDIILELLFYCDGGVGLYELSKKMNISLNNVYKIAISLVDKKILEVIK